MKKISYNCRKRVADSRLRIKGRFISKKVNIIFYCEFLEEFLFYIDIKNLQIKIKDTEKINKLMGGKQEDAFNNKNNLNLDYIQKKLNITKNAEG